MQTSQSIRNLQKSHLVKHHGRVDSIAWTRLEMLRLQAVALEQMLELHGGAYRADSKLLTNAFPQREIPINAQVVFGD
jgi:hypothetical protein